LHGRIGKAPTAGGNDPWGGVSRRVFVRGVGKEVLMLLTAILAIIHCSSFKKKYFKTDVPGAIWGYQGRTDEAARRYSHYTLSTPWVVDGDVLITKLLRT
jgi:hypothetical protein